MCANKITLINETKNLAQFGYGRYDSPELGQLFFRENFAQNLLWGVLRKYLAGNSSISENCEQILLNNFTGTGN